MTYTEWRDEYSRLLDLAFMTLNEDDHDLNTIATHNPQPAFKAGYTPAEAVAEAIADGYTAMMYYTGDAIDEGECLPDDYS